MIRILKLREQRTEIRNQIILLSILCILFFALGSTCLAEDMRFEVTVDKNKISIGQTANLSLAFYGTQDIARPDLPDIHGFNWRYMGPSTRVSIVNGRVSSSITHNYVLIPLETGEFSIPPFSVYYKGNTYTSEPIPIEVVSGAFTATPPSGAQKPADRGYVDVRDRAFLTIEAGKRKAYINEIIPLTIKLYVNQLTIRDIQYPEFQHEGFSVEQFGEPKQYREVLSGVAYDVIEFNTAMFATRPGELKIGPAFLEANLIRERQRRRPSSFFDDDFFDSFFRSYDKEPLRLASVDVPITIMDIPASKAPEGFTGSLGDYRFYVEAAPKTVKVGDPITLKMTVTGDGNFKSVKPPELDFGDNFKIYEPNVKQEGARKTFEQVIIPKTDKVKEIPEISFVYFDTKAGEYRRIRNGPIPIEVKPLEKGEKLEIFETPEGFGRPVRHREVLGRDIIYIKEVPGSFRKRNTFLVNNIYFIFLQFIPIIALISVLIFQKRRERLETDVRYARSLRAPKKAKSNLSMARNLLDSREPVTFYDAVFKTLQEYLGDKFHLSTAGITSNVVDTLAGYGISQDVLDNMKKCFEACDMARYAPSGITPENMKHTYRLLEDIIDRLERVKKR